MRFIPVNFSEAYGPVHQTDASDAFVLTSSAWTIVPAQTCTVTDATAAGNRFNPGHLPDEFEVHAGRCYRVANEGAIGRANEEAFLWRGAATKTLLNETAAHSLGNCNSV